MTVSFPVISVEEARAIDAAAVRDLGIPSLLLMENAARGICQLIRQHYANCGKIVIACGFGNNGGDGLALARLLAAEDIDAHTYLIDADRRLSEDAAANRKVLESCKLAFAHDPNGEKFRAGAQKLSSNSLVVDCLLGTGILGDPKTPYAEVIEAINASAAQVLAVDVPSGLNAQTGSAGSPTVVANRTITFVGQKAGFKTAEGNRYTGQVSVAPIGLPLDWTMNFLKQHRSGNTDR